jgi:tetratricopeptide (TPR) repeat protein
MRTNTSAGTQDEIPLLYFLNRLYVSVTRAQSYLFIIDTPQGVDRFWTKWTPADLRFVARGDLAAELDNHPAFRESFDWVSWGDYLFEKAEDRADTRDYERARSAYLKGGAADRVKKVDACVAEVGENWQLAGDLFYEIRDFEKAATCFEKCKNWQRAIQALQRLPSNVARNRRIAISSFYNGRSDRDAGRKRDAALRFLMHAESDPAIDKEHLIELAETFDEVGEGTRSAELLEKLFVAYKETSLGIKAGQRYRKVGSFEKALKIFTACGHYGPEYLESLRQVSQDCEKRQDFERAAELYEELAARGEKQALVSKGKCLFKLGRHSAAVDAFERSGYSGKEYDLSEAELCIQGGKIAEAVGLLDKNGEYGRIISLFPRGTAPPEVGPYVAEAYFRVGDHLLALESFKRLIPQAEEEARRSKEFGLLNKLLRRIADCHYALGSKDEAYNYYREGRDYVNAARLGEELGKPQREIRLLSAEGARSQRPPDFETAIRIYDDIGETKLAASAKGHYLRFQRKYFEAIRPFTEAGELEQVVDCIDNLSELEEKVQAEIHFLKAALLMVQPMSRQDRDKVMDWIKEIREEENWPSLIQPNEMGKLYEMFFGRFVDALDFYEKYPSESWARDGWMRVKEAQCRYHEARNELKKAAEIREAMRKKAAEWRV